MVTVEVPVVMDAPKSVVIYSDGTYTIDGAIPDPCEGIICENVCIGYDLYSQKCVDGTCVPDQLIEANSQQCGYDPCTGVDCSGYTCVGFDKYSMKCVNGECVPDQLIEQNSPDCGYDPCAGVDCSGYICVGTDKYSQKCVNGECVPDQLIEQNSPDCGYEEPPPGDPCANIQCPETICVGYDLYTTQCVNGECVPEALIEANSQQCGYVPPACIDGETMTETCPDGTEVVTHICQNGEWVPTGERCPSRIPMSIAVTGGAFILLMLAYILLKR